MVVYRVIRRSKVAFARSLPAENINRAPRDAEDGPQTPPVAEPSTGIFRWQKH
jgi:hypothetical protein